MSKSNESALGTLKILHEVNWKTDGKVIPYLDNRKLIKEFTNTK